ARKPGETRAKSASASGWIWGSWHLPLLSFAETSGFAGGLVQFDSSRNGPMREPVVRAVPPHPDPLPSAFAARQSAAPARRRQGDGQRAPRSEAERSGLYSVARRVHPLPKGEGRAEGKETIAPRSACPPLDERPNVLRA